MNYQNLRTYVERREENIQHVAETLQEAFPSMDGVIESYLDNVYQKTK
jgi:hypothetical protein